MCAINRDNRVQFKDGTLRHTDEATYLGILTKTHFYRNFNPSCLTATWKSLDLFWKQTCCSLKNNILMCNSLIRTKLLNAFETVEMPPRHRSQDWKHSN